MSLAEVGKLVIVCACGMGALFGAVAVFMFGVRLRKDGDGRYDGIGFMVIGVLLLGIVAGLTLIAAEKGL